MRNARRSENFVAIFRDEIILPIMQRGHGKIAQHIVERPHQRGSFRAFQIVRDRAD